MGSRELASRFGAGIYGFSLYPPWSPRDVLGGALSVLSSVDAPIIPAPLGSGGAIPGPLLDLHLV